MPVGISQRWEKGTAEQYEAAHRLLNIESDPPDGFLVHSAGPVHGGWGVIDFWESRAHFDTFIGERLRPAMEKADVSLGPPAEVKEFPVHNLDINSAA